MMKSTQRLASISLVFDGDSHSLEIDLAVCVAKAICNDVTKWGCGVDCFDNPMPDIKVFQC